MEKPEKIYDDGQPVYYDADEMDTYLAQKDKEISELVDALEYLIGILEEHKENGCCESNINKKELSDAKSALNKHKTINE